MTAKRVSYREIFFAYNGPGPYACNFCGEDVAMQIVVIHHVDHDRTNNELVNLVPSHGPCHASHHLADYWTDREKSAEHRAAIGRSKRGVPRSEETKAKISATRKARGYKASAAAIEATRAAHTGVPRSAETRQKISESMKRRAR